MADTTTMLDRSLDFSTAHSEISEELLPFKSSISERWSLLLFMIFILCLFVLSWTIYYPDVVKAPVVLTSQGAPKELIAHQSGRIVRLLAKNNSSVRKNEPVAWLESAAEHSEILALSAWIDSIRILLELHRVKELPFLRHTSLTKLGDIQPLYQQFVVARQTFEDYFINGYYEKKRQMLEEDIRALTEKRKQGEMQLTLITQDVAVSQHLFDMNDSLYVQKVISNAEYLNERSKLLNKKQLITGENNALLDLEATLRNKQREMNELDHNMSQQQSLFEQSMTTLKTAIDGWCRNFIVKSPIDGKISLIMPIQENQYVTQGKLLGYITPLDSNYYVQATLPQQNFGNLSIGEKVHIRFDAYPYQDAGYVNGSLAYISTIPTERGFFAMVRLDNGLTTSRKLQIAYRSGLKGEAIIFIKKTRLLLKLFHKTSTVSP